MKLIGCAETIVITRLLAKSCITIATKEKPVVAMTAGFFVFEIKK